MISPSHLVITAKSFTSYMIEDIAAVVMSLRSMMSLKMTTIGLHRKSPVHWPASPPSPVLLAPFSSSLGSSCSMRIDCIKDILQICTSSSYIICFCFTIASTQLALKDTPKHCRSINIKHLHLQQNWPGLRCLDSSIPWHPPHSSPPSPPCQPPPSPPPCCSPPPHSACPPPPPPLSPPPPAAFSPQVGSAQHEVHACKRRVIFKKQFINIHFWKLMNCFEKWGNNAKTKVTIKSSWSAPI